MFTIYALTDPETSVIRYVGKTNNPGYRLKSHSKPVLKPRTHRGYWVNSLLARGLQPAMVVCDTCDDEATANELEKAWIKLFRMAGVPLTNCTDGGDGMAGYKHTEESKQKNRLASLGRECTTKAKEKLRLANLGKQHTDETKAKPRGLHHSDETKQKMRANHRGMRGRHQSDEAKENIRRALQGRQASAEEVEKNRLGHIGKKYSRRSPSEETRQKLRLANLGKVLSEEHNSKISAALKSRKARA